MKTISHDDRRAFYQAALAGLMALEGRRSSQRWFGADADARWKVLEGDLSGGDRLDLVIRDADAQGYGAVGARVVFDREGVAQDDAFGVGWEGLGRSEADALLRAGLQGDVARSGAALGARVLAAWAHAGAATSTLTPLSVALRPAERVVVTGPSAIAATCDALLGRSDLDWAEQVWVVATPAAHRQLAGLCAALCHVQRAPVIVTASAASTLQAGGLRLIASDDAASADREAATALTEAAPRA